MTSYRSLSTQPGPPRIREVGRKPEAAAIRARSVTFVPEMPAGLKLRDRDVESDVFRRIDATSKEACAVSDTPVAMRHNVSATPRRKRMSVLRWPLDSIDDDHIERRGA